MTAVIETRDGRRLHTGKREAAPARGLPYAEVREGVAHAIRKASLPTHPAVFGHGGDFAQNGWGMLGNGPDDTVQPGFLGCGDCAWAGPAHETMEAAFDGRAMVIPSFSGKTVVDQYSAYCGYVIGDDSTDVGSDPQQVLDWRQTKGLYDDGGTPHRIGHWFSLTAGDVNELYEAMWLFECVGIGFAIQRAQEDQFNRGVAWDYVRNSPVLGGHYISGVGRPRPGYGRAISWGEAVYFTDSFYAHQSDEAQAFIDPLRFRAATGKDAEGMTSAQVENALAVMAAAKLGLPAGQR